MICLRFAIEVLLYADWPRSKEFRAREGRPLQNTDLYRRLPGSLYSSKAVRNNSLRVLKALEHINREALYSRRALTSWRIYTD